jgi:predicted HD phosphohydrolase
MDATTLPPQMDPETVLAMVEDLIDLPYGLEPVDQRSHALQSAKLAIDEGADPELVTAALLHDIGRHPALLAQYPDLDHEDSAKCFLDQHFGERVGWLAWAHVPAKLHLADTEPSYADGFSAGSVASLIEQRQSVTSEVLEAFAAHPWRDDAIRLRRWDDAAKVPDGAEPEPERLRQILAAALSTGKTK